MDEQKRILNAYQYSYGDGTLYFDCYLDGAFVARTHSDVETAIIALNNNATYQIVA